MWELPNIKQSEFACKCGCGFMDADINLGIKLQVIRDITKRPVKVISGCRCESHNKKVGGKPDSAHLRGKAVDFEIFDSNHRQNVLKIADVLFNRIGIGNNFLHVDNDLSLPQNVTWTY